MKLRQTKEVSKTSNKGKCKLPQATYSHAGSIFPPSGSQESPQNLQHQETSSNSPLTRLPTFWGAPNSYQRWSTCLGWNIVCPLCMRAPIKNKAKQNKNNPCSAHLFRAGDLLETYCGEEETATPSSPNDNSKAGFQTNWKVMGSPRQQGPKGLLGPASYKVICSLQGLPHPHFSLLPLLYMCCPA